jgi:2,4-didehydro-3-deoxy-L-rhamnonate hydrolase
MRIGPAGSERPVVRIDDTHYVDVADVVIDFNEAFFGSDGLTRLSEVVQERSAARQQHEFAGERIGAYCQTALDSPHRVELQRPRCRDRSGCPRRTHPFHQVAHQVAQHTRWPERRRPHSAWLDQAGLGSRAGRCDQQKDQLSRLYGRCVRRDCRLQVVNDVSARAFQIERSGQWSKGKSAETFNPAGPWLVTPDEIDDVRDLRMWLDVSGVHGQDGSTSTMIFDPLSGGGGAARGLVGGWWCDVVVVRRVAAPALGIGGGPNSAFVV